MYNAGKYIAEELDTILEQTLQNFEVIVVDDCSTDLGCEIVESYIPKFGGRLRLYHTEENSGTAAVPRNMGLPLSGGEYVFFMDADDMFVENALEQMYTLAKKFDADVVYCDRYYSSDALGKNRRLRTFQEGEPVEEPTLETEDMRERFQGILDKRYGPTPWLKLVRRQFLIDHEILYPVLRVSDDNIWTQGLVIHAKRFLRIPDALYIFRSAPDSITRIQKPPKVKINFWMKPALLGLKTLDKFMSTSEFFQENPDCRHAILEKFLNVRFDWIFDSTRQLSETEIYEAIKDGLGEFFGDYDVVIPALTTYICRQNKMLEENAFSGVEEYKQRIAELEEAFLGLSEKINHIPAISVVIPLYNNEKYIGECLDSLLIQTFQDFEVIVVDDCSTDKSVAVVKSYVDKFDGRLKLTQTEENSGGGGYVPRNLGFKLANGEYVFFLDSDDFLLASALETLYNAAKEYDVEVVYTSAFYDVNGINKIARHRDGLGRKWFKSGIEDRLILIENNPHELFQQFFQLDEGEGNFHACWSKFVRRDFLLKNNITFLNLVSSGDVIWCINVYAHVKRFLRLPIAVYFYRAYNTTSVVRTILTPAEQTCRWVSGAVAFLKGLNALQVGVEFLRENPIYCQKIAEVHVKWYMDRLARVLENLGNRDVYEIFSNKFEDDTFNGAAPFFFNIIEEKRKELLDRQLFRRLKPYVTARIDILRTPKSDNDDFEIVYVSDEKANVTKPAWLQKEGEGYVIESYAGKVEFIAKSAVDGQIKLFFRGLLVVDPNDKTKRIPYWIDYTRFTVDDNVIFGKTTPAWHNKAYKHVMNIKADEEVKFQVEWLPHRDDRADLSAKVVPPQEPQKIQENNSEKLRESEVLISELRTALDNEKKLHNNDLELIGKFKDYFTARADIQLVTKQKGDFQIISVSDNKADIKKPAWLQKNGIGYQIQSYVGKLEFTVKGSVDGKINLKLRGLDVRTPEDKTKRIPYWINYTKLIVDEEIIFDEITPAWLEKFYSYNTAIKAGEEIKIQIEWLPHGNN